MTTQNTLAAGVIGLGSMGLGMAQSMVKRGIKVAGFDINAAAVAKLAEAGGSGAASVADVAKECGRAACCGGERGADRYGVVR